MLQGKRAPFFAAIFCLLAAPALPGCSVDSKYRIPTTLQLARDADAVVLARIEDGGPSFASGFRAAKIVPFAILKGRSLPSEIQYKDAILSNGRAKATRSDPRNLVEANPDAFSGACQRYTFDKGMIVVAFLRKSGAGFVPDLSPFARALEDVPSPDALWVKAVKIYISIAALPKPMWRKEMERRRVLLRFELDDPDARLIALELDRALRDRL
jgi:hypothetical protein